MQNIWKEAKLVDYDDDNNNNNKRAVYESVEKFKQEIDIFATIFSFAKISTFLKNSEI